MSALPVEPVEARSGDRVVASLDVMLAELATLVADGRPASDADRIDRLDRLTRMRAAVAAAETAEIVRSAPVPDGAAADRRRAPEADRARDRRPDRADAPRT